MDNYILVTTNSSKKLIEVNRIKNIEEIDGKTYITGRVEYDEDSSTNVIEVKESIEQVHQLIREERNLEHSLTVKLNLVGVDNSKANTIITELQRLLKDN